MMIHFYLSADLLQFYFCAEKESNASKKSNDFDF